MWNSVFTANQVGLNATDGAHISAHENTVVGNEEYGAWVPHGNAGIEATDNWWGDVTGPSGDVADPETGKIADGDGDRVSENVRFDPWEGKDELTTVSIHPDRNTVDAGDQFTTNVTIDTAVDVVSAEFRMTFDPEVLTATDLSVGNFLPCFAA